MAIYRYNPKSGVMEEFESVHDRKYVETFGSPYRSHYPTYPGSTGYSGYTPPPKPWEGVSLGKFPSTWFTLVRMYFSHEWYQITRYKYDGPDIKYNDSYYAGSI